MIKINYLNTDNEDLLEHNKFKPLDNLLKRFNETLNKVEPEESDSIGQMETYKDVRFF